MDEEVKKNLDRAKEIVDSWPDWKKEFTVTEMSERDNPYARNKDSGHGE